MRFKYFEIRNAAEMEAKDKEISGLRKALEQIEQQLDYGQINTALYIARRALEGSESGCRIVGPEEVDSVTEAGKEVIRVFRYAAMSSEQVRAYQALKAALEAEECQTPSQPTIHAMFETVDPSVPVIGTTAAPIKRIEQNDDGSYLVVIDHWPQ